MTLGEKLQRLRKARGMTQEQLAEQVGVSRQSLSGWENDTALPDTANVVALADLFDVTTDYLLRDMPGESTAHANAPIITPAVRYVQPKKKAPLPLLVAGVLLLGLGTLGWIGFYIAQCIHPVHYGINGVWYTGVQAFIRSNHMEVPYYTGIAAMVIGALCIVYYFSLQWVLGRSQRRGDPRTES